MKNNKEKKQGYWQFIIFLGMCMVFFYFIGFNDLPSKDKKYQDLYEDKILNESIDSAYTNGTIDTANFLVKAMVIEGKQCNLNGIQLPYQGQVYNFHLEDCLIK